MEHFQTFDTGKKSCHLEISYAHPNVLCAGHAGRIRRAARLLDNVDSVMGDREYPVFHGRYRGLPVTLFSTGIGAASVSALLPEVIEASSDRRMSIIRIGTSGALQKELHIGDFVITTDTQREESTSDKIMHPGYVGCADAVVVAALQEAANRVKADFQKVYIGTTRVTDEIYQSAERAKHRDNGVVQAVSMEASAIFGERDLYHTKYKGRGFDIVAGELLVISDNPLAEGPVDQTAFQANQPLIEPAHIRAGLEALVALSDR